MQEAAVLLTGLVDKISLLLPSHSARFRHAQDVCYMLP